MNSREFHDEMTKGAPLARNAPNFPDLPARLDLEPLNLDPLNLE